MADRDQSPTHGRPDSPDEPVHGNRPATGARLVDGGGAFPSSYGVGQEATDFLGLSNELVGTPGAEPAESLPAPTAYGEPADAGTTWLMHPEEQGSEVEDPEGLEHAGAQQAEAPRGRSQGTWKAVVGALLLGASGAVAYMKWVAPGSAPVVTETAHGPTGVGTMPGGNGAATPSGGSTTTDGTEVVTGAGSGTGTSSSTADATQTDATGSGDDSVAVETATSSETGPRLGRDRLQEWMQNNPGEQSEPPLSTTMMSTLLGEGPDATDGAPADTDPLRPGATRTTPTTALTPRTAVRPTGTTGPGAQTTGNATSPEATVGVLGTATSEDLAGMWSGDTIPLEALDAEDRLLTPQVGEVRVVLNSGEVFDGKLYALGAGKVWLETTIGRLALASSRVTAITTVTYEEVDGKTVEDLPRMRVRTPGGIFFGKVIAREDDRITLLVADGGRIVLQSHDVEPAPLGDTRVVGRIDP